MLEKIISGGQTGADQAALDAATELDFEIGGWCPKGRFNEQGIIPTKYNQLIEIEGEFKTEQENYDARTKLNIADSHGTLILIPEHPIPKSIQDGTLLTIREVELQHKPYLILNLSSDIHVNISCCTQWINEYDIRTLNVAGPRESSHKNIGSTCYHFLHHFLSEYTASLRPSF